MPYSKIVRCSIRISFWFVFATLAFLSMACLFGWGLLCFFLSLAYFGEASQSGWFSHGALAVLALGWLPGIALLKLGWRVAANTLIPISNFFAAILLLGCVFNLAYVGLILQHSAMQQWILCICLCAPTIFVALCAMVYKKGLPGQSLILSRSPRPDLGAH